MSYPSDPTDNQWDLLESVFNVPEKRGRKHADDLRTVPAAMLYVALTGYQWRYLAPVAPRVVPVATHDNRASEPMLEH